MEDTDRRIAITTVSLLIGATGAVLNILCLLFYLRHPSTSLGRRLLTCLCVSDLGMCLVTPGTELIELAVWFVDKDHDTLRSVLVMIYLHLSGLAMIFYESTTFLTVTLSFTRTLSFFRPTHRHSRRALLITGVSFHVILVLREACLVGMNWADHTGSASEELLGFKELLDNIAVLVTMGVTFLGLIIVCVLTLCCVVRLQCGNDLLRVTTANNRRATVTVVIVATLFCFFTLSYNSCLIAELFELESLVCMVVGNYFILLNSMVNPVVFLARNSGMRSYLKDVRSHGPSVLWSRGARGHTIGSGAAPLSPRSELGPGERNGRRKESSQM